MKFIKDLVIKKNSNSKYRFKVRPCWPPTKKKVHVFVRADPQSLNGNLKWFMAEFGHEKVKTSDSDINTSKVRTCLRTRTGIWTRVSAKLWSLELFIWHLHWKLKKSLYTGITLKKVPYQAKVPWYYDVRSCTLITIFTKFSLVIYKTNIFIPVATLLK